MTSFLTICSNIFDRLANFWRSKKAKRLFSNLMVVSFVAMLSVALLNHFKLLTAFPFLSGVNFFTAIHFSLTILLLVEMTALLFVHSIV